VAGGIGADVKIGDLVLADGAIQHDVDTTQIGDKIGMVSGINLVVIPTSSNMNRVLAEAAKCCAYQGDVHVGRIASGDQFISSAEKLHWIASTFGAIACEMESGSIAQVCYINGTEYTAVRCISDNADSNAGVDYEQFSTFAAHQTTELLCTALPMLEKAK
ncbi:MAG: 5'-methylthioadenosine/S-adenosylhomocysteine nucleosidase, partial [Clostridiales bacterium]|nr:5'-methylthioadenosine/S-adenosylhomocysteine nucleosidase [Clostridiales bacterium]